MRSNQQYTRKMLPPWWLAERCTIATYHEVSNVRSTAEMTYLTQESSSVHVVRCNRFSEAVPEFEKYCVTGDVALFSRNFACLTSASAVFPDTS
jgi:hypothetical protein